MTRTVGESNEPKAWKEGQARARAARALVAAQLSEMVVEREATGGRAQLIRRLRQLAEAEGARDGAVLRAAVMEVALAAAHWAVSLDLRQHR